MPAVEFSLTHSYLPAGDGISLPLFLNDGAERVKLFAQVDTGASHCLFERRHAELLNLDVEAGDPMAFRTATGRVQAFGHLVTMGAARVHRTVGGLAKLLLGDDQAPLGWPVSYCVRGF